MQLKERKRETNKPNPKGDGAPYVKRFNEEYEKMTPEEHAKIDRAMAELDELLGPDDDIDTAKYEK